MAIPQVYSWPAASSTAVALLKTLGAAGTIPLNGTLSKSTDNGLFVNFDGIARVVTLTSTNNLSAVNVTITGTLNGSVVSETRAGPNNNTVATTQVFNSVTSITTDAAVTAMSAGTGQTGYTNWFMVNNHAGVMNMNIAADISGTIDYSFQVTLDDVNTDATPLVFTPITALTGATTDILGSYTAPAKFCNIKINSSTGNATLTATILQQAIT